MTATLSVQQYPFVKDSQKVLSKLNITYETIDTTNMYDEILQEAFHDIQDAVTKIRLSKGQVITRLEKSNYEREVVKFYLSLMIIKASTILTKQFIRYYIHKFEIIVNHYTTLIRGGPINIIPYYLILFREFGLEWKLIKTGDLEFVKIHVNNYLDFATLIENNDPPEYQLLKLVNCSLHKGFVYFHIKDFYDFQHMLNKLLQERIRKLVDNLEEKIECQKIEKCRDQLTKYMTDKGGLSYEPLTKKLEYGEVTQSDLVNNEEVLKTIKEFMADPRFMSVLEFQLPPCITAMLEQIRMKQELNHAQNILLGSYLGAKGYTVEQIDQIFKLTNNYNPRVAKYNIKYLLNKKLKPMNCRNLVTENLCNKQNDRTNQCNHINNPLVFKMVLKK